ncbi:MAG: hypothetical protein WBD36_11735 [Bacteroidota bacterium]
MFRFDGKQWKTTRYSTEEGGPIPPIGDINSLVVLSANNMWFVGERFWTNLNPPPNLIDSNLIIRYDGVSWQEFKVRVPGTLLSVNGTNSDDIWACGYFGNVLHYNGVVWERDSIPLSVREGSSFILRDICTGLDKQVYGLGFVSSSADITMFYFFQRIGATWAVVDSTLDGTYGFGTNDLWASPTGTLYSVGRGVFRRDGTKWTKILSTQSSLFRIWGYSDDSFFAVGANCTVFHYNGSDFYQYPALVNNNVLNFGVWGAENELFVVGTDGGKSFIYHGR